MDNQTSNLVDECKRQEQSCLYTSTSLYELAKSRGRWRTLFVLAPILLGGIGGIATLLQKETFPTEWQKIVQIGASICALLAGMATAIYKALNLDVDLDVVRAHAQQFKALQDRFRQAWRVTALGPFPEFKKSFDDLMTQMDAARATAPTAPERYFAIAQKKIQSGHYEFSVDTKGEQKPQLSS